jgi:hypothetical protein
VHADVGGNVDGNKYIAALTWYWMASEAESAGVNPTATVGIWPYRGAVNDVITG